MCLAATELVPNLAKCTGGTTSFFLQDECIQRGNKICVKRRETEQKVGRVKNETKKEKKKERERVMKEMRVRVE